MSRSSSARRARSRSGQVVPALAAIDRRLLGVLCTHRVVTQEQLGRLFPEVPERTLRYRTRRLHDLGLAGRTRPYRERGSAPSHHWPTRRADCLMRGDPVPRGGERREPNPVFVAHAAALTGLYVALVTEIGATGLHLREYRREGEAREAFALEGKERALAPDATVILVDRDKRQFEAFVEIDLGTMSHARLRQKAELYAAYAVSDAWCDRHPFLPALLFPTTIDARAARFLDALARQLAAGAGRYSPDSLVAGAAGIAWAPGRLLGEPCLADLDLDTGLSLLDILEAARAPYEQACAYQRERDTAEDERRRALRENPGAMREWLAEHHYELDPYLQAFGPAAQTTIALLTQSAASLSSQEGRALGAMAWDLGDALPEPSEHELPRPGTAARREIEQLTRCYREEQAAQINALAERYDAGPSLIRAWRLLRDGGLLDRIAVARLSEEAAHDAVARREQHECQQVYLEWREHAARQLARGAGPLGRLTHRPEEYYAQLDRERLRVCARCEQTIFPGARAASSFSAPASYACHYCGETGGTRPYDQPSATSKESEANR